jgi:hypothetical protein
LRPTQTRGAGTDRQPCRPLAIDVALIGGLFACVDRDGMALSAERFIERDERHEDETCDAKESHAKINSLHAMTSVPPYKERLHYRLVQVRAQAAVTVIVLSQNAGEPLGQIEDLFAGKDLRYIVAGDFVEIVMVVSKEELDEVFGRIDEIKLDETVGIAVEQVDDEITVAIAGIVCVHFQLTADQATRLSRGLAVAAENAAKFLASTEA